MIFGRFRFSHQVARRLFAMGWRPENMPSKIMFRDLCEGLRATGYDADNAAHLWNQCLQNNMEAIEQLKRDTGFYGILHLSQFFASRDELMESSESPPVPKRKKVAKRRKRE